MSSSQEQMAQLVRYASLCDILGACSHYDTISDVTDFITKKLRYVINGYAWTYHGVASNTLQIVARKSKMHLVESEPIEALDAFKSFCKDIERMTVLSVADGTTE